MFQTRPCSLFGARFYPPARTLTHFAHSLRSHTPLTRFAHSLRSLASLTHFAHYRPPRGGDAKRPEIRTE